MKYIIENINNKYSQIEEALVMEKSYGPLEFKVGDLVSLGDANPRRVAYLGTASVSLMQTKQKPKGYAHNPMHGGTELFWSDKKQLYWLQGYMGKVIGEYKPEEVKISSAI